MTRGACARCVQGALALALIAAATTRPAHATVLFENPGNLTGWDKVYTQKQGTNTIVASPTYRGTTAYRAWQTYLTSDAANYHSEVIKANSVRTGQDVYFGQAIYLAPDWVFHDQNVTFQQWAPDDNSGPWILMFVQGSHLRVGGRAFAGIKDLGDISGERGKWIRVVTRFHMVTAGLMEVWVNGDKTLSLPGDFTVSGGLARWSSGIYCTRWDTEAPAGQRMLAIVHDNLRTATTYEEADPASWGEGGSTPDAGSGGNDGGGGDVDAGEVDAADAGGGGGGGGGGANGGAGGGGGGEAAGGAGGGGGGAGGVGGGAGGVGGTGKGGAGAGGKRAGGSTGSGGAGGAGGAGGDDEAQAPPASAGCGCRLHDGGGGGGAVMAAGLAALASAFMRRRRRG